MKRRLNASAQSIDPWSAYSIHFQSTWALVISVYSLSLAVAHISDATRRLLVVTEDSARIKTNLLRIPPGSLKCPAYSTITPDLSLTSHLKDNQQFLVGQPEIQTRNLATRNIVFTSPTLYLLSKSAS